jgi:hypothetical protein
LDKSPRFLDAKGAAMPGLMFMANGKEGKSNAVMQKKCGKRQFLLQYQKRYVDLRISNNSLNNFLSAVVLQVFTENMPLKKLFEELFQGITLDDVFDNVTLTKTRNKVRRIKTEDTLLHEGARGVISCPSAPLRQYSKYGSTLARA